MTEPSRRERTRPAELLLISGGLALFVGAVVFMATRDFALGVIFLGVAFILALVTLAMLALAVKPDDAERGDLDEQDREF